MKKLFAFLLVALFIFSCGGSEIAPSTSSIYLDYWNTSGKSPEIKFDNIKTSREIKIDFTKTFGGFAQGSEFSKVVIDNFRIIDENSNNYNIESIKAYEFRKDANAWKEDVEFTMSFTQSEDISVVLVLDRSQSLGEDFGNVKQYAIDFIEKMFDERKNIKVGIVDFATDVQNLPITNDKKTIINYINGLQQGLSTTLYDAMDLGIEMLLKSKSQSRVLFTFTDGTDNNSSPGVTSDYLLNKIKNDDNPYKMSSFLIGLDGKGGVDRTVLQKLASSSGTVSFPNSVTELKKVFDKFGRVISNVYSLTYIRNQQIIPKNTPIKLKFEIRTMQ